MQQNEEEAAYNYFTIRKLRPANELIRLVVISFLAAGSVRYGPLACKMFMKAYAYQDSVSDEKISCEEIVTSSISCAKKDFEDEGVKETDIVQKASILLVQRRFFLCS